MGGGIGLSPSEKIAKYPHLQSAKQKYIEKDTIFKIHPYPPCNETLGTPLREPSLAITESKAPTGLSNYFLFIIYQKLFVQNSILLKSYYLTFEVSI